MKQGETMGRGLRNSGRATSGRAGAAVVDAPAPVDPRLEAITARARQLILDRNPDEAVRQRLTVALDQMLEDGAALEANHGLEAGATLEEVTTFSNFLSRGRVRTTPPPANESLALRAAWWAYQSAQPDNPFGDDDVARNLAGALARIARRNGPADQIYHYYDHWDHTAASTFSREKYLLMAEAIGSGRWQDYRYDLNDRSVRQQLDRLTPEQRAIWMEDLTVDVDSVAIPEPVQNAARLTAGELRLLLIDGQVPEDLARLLADGEAAPRESLERWRARRATIGQALGARRPIADANLRRDLQNILTELNDPSDPTQLTPDQLRALSRRYALAEDLLALLLCSPSGLLQNQLRPIAGNEGDEGAPRAETARRKLERLIHSFGNEPAIQRSLQRTLDAVQRTGDAIRQTRFSATDSSDPTVLFNVGAVPVATCQNYREGMYRETLIAYVIDADKKVAILRDPTGRIVARSILRLVTTVGDNTPALHLESIYTDQRDAQAISSALSQLAREKADRMGIQAYMTTRSWGWNRDAIVGQPSNFHVSPSRAGMQYIDSMGGRAQNARLREGHVSGSAVPGGRNNPQAQLGTSLLCAHTAMAARIQDHGANPNRAIVVADLLGTVAAPSIDERMARLRVRVPQAEATPPTTADWVAAEYQARGGIERDAAKARATRELRRMSLDPKQALTNQLALALAVQRREGCALYQARRTVRAALQAHPNALNGDAALTSRGLEIASAITRGESLATVLGRPQPHAAVPDIGGQAPLLADLCAFWSPARGVPAPPPPDPAPAQLGKSVAEFLAEGRAWNEAHQVPAAERVTAGVLSQRTGIPVEGEATHRPKLRMLLQAEAMLRNGVPAEEARNWADAQVQAAQPHLPVAQRGQRRGGRLVARAQAGPDQAPPVATDYALLALALMRRQRQHAPGEAELDFSTAVQRVTAELAGTAIKKRPTRTITARGVLAARAIERGINLTDAFDNARLELADAGLEPDDAAPPELFAGMWFADLEPPAGA